MNAERPAIALIERAPGWWECPLRVDGLYGITYWDEYQQRDRTPMGHALTKARIDMVKRRCTRVVDVGIGGGAFVIAAANCGLDPRGTDINHLATGWLRVRGQLWDGGDVEAMTFWDSIEHIDDPSVLLSKTQWAFISTPVYDDEAAVRASKHFKPGEHIHYWSVCGMIDYIAAQGFGLMEYNTMESDLGREGIGSFAFRRMR